MYPAERLFRTQLSQFVAIHMLRRLGVTPVLLLSWLLVMPAMVAPVHSASAQSAQEHYAAAIKALRKKDDARYSRHMKALGSHPLAPFAEYEKLKRSLGSLKPDTVHDFVAANQDAVVSELLQSRYLSLLIKRKKWRDVVTESEGLSLSTEKRCHVLYAKIRTGTSLQQIDADIADMWRFGASRPKACDPVFAAWRKAGLLSDARVIERIELAMRKGRTKLSRWLAKSYLKPSSHRWIERWLAMRRKPVKFLNSVKWNRDDSPFAPLIIVHAVQRAARKNLDDAFRIVEGYQKRFDLTPEELNRIALSVGMKAAVDHHADASTWHGLVDEEHITDQARAWRIRSALRVGKFEDASNFIDTLPAEEREKKKWRYWKARMNELSGDSASALAVYQELATSRHFYGFLAADRLGVEYAMNNEQLPPESANAISGRRSLVMAYELYKLDEKQMARRQWRFATGMLSDEDKRIAALTAHQWGWHDRAIITAGKSGFLNDLEVRFPVLYEQSVADNASRQSIDPEWVYGVMRQESAFMTDARSGVGALGLMQLMPQTGRKMGRKLKIKVRNNASILDPKTNISLGTAYLRTVLDLYNQHTVLATASYNAGPHKVRAWLPTSTAMDADIWIETIPYSETRNFVKNVLGFTAVYGVRLGGPAKPLQKRMPSIGPAT